MAVRSSITFGLPDPNYVVELGDRQSALPGEYIVESGHAIVTVVAGQIDNFTLSSTASVPVQANVANTINNFTLLSVGNIAITASLTKTLSNFTLDATGTVTDVIGVNKTIDDVTLSSDVQVIVSASLDATLGAFTLSAADKVVVSASLDETLVNFALSATGAVLSRSSDAGIPWWWAQYQRRFAEERRIPREAEGFGVVLGPYGSGRAEHVVPRGGNAVASVPYAYGVGDHGVAAQGIAQAAVAGKAWADIGVQGRHAAAELRPFAVGRASSLIVGEGRGSVGFEVSARAIHSRGATGYGNVVQIFGAAFGSVGKSAALDVELPALSARGFASVGIAGGGGGDISTSASGVAFLGVVGQGNLSMMLPRAQALAEHDPDNEEALTLALLAA